MEIKVTCPLGHTCEKASLQKNGDTVIERCMSYLEIEGLHPNTGQPTKEWGCGLFKWQPMFLLENTMTNRGQTAALESFRNEVVKGQNQFNSLLANGKPKRIHNA